MYKKHHIKIILLIIKIDEIVNYLKNQIKIMIIIKFINKNRMRL